VPYTIVLGALLADRASVKKLKDGYFYRCVKQA
jgi:hypothetical protein